MQPYTSRRSLPFLRISEPLVFLCGVSALVTKLFLCHLFKARFPSMAELKLCFLYLSVQLFPFCPIHELARTALCEPPQIPIKLVRESVKRARVNFSRSASGSGVGGGSLDSPPSVTGRARLSLLPRSPRRRSGIFQNLAIPVAGPTFDIADRLPP